MQWKDDTAYFARVVNYTCKTFIKSSAEMLQQKRLSFNLAITKLSLSYIFLLKRKYFIVILERSIFVKNEGGVVVQHSTYCVKTEGSYLATGLGKRK